MRNIFYNLVENITENITEGLIEINDTKFLLNVTFLVIVLYILCGVYTISKIATKNISKHMICEQEEES